jgi:hypothetical protein
MVLTATLGLIVVVVVLVGLLLTLVRGHYRKHEGNKPPGPMPWPIFGSIHLLAPYESPFQGLTALAKQYGDVYSITLGNTKCVVVNSFQLIKEVLITKGSQFGDRPNFIRFHKLFGGDRNNCKSRDLYNCLAVLSHIHYLASKLDTYSNDQTYVMKVKALLGSFDHTEVEVSSNNNLIICSL